MTGRLKRCAASSGLAVGLGCDAVVAEVHVGLLFPEDAAPLAQADNASVQLAPSGFTETFATEGASFELEVELEPDETPRTLAVFYARGSTLLGHGRTPPFLYRAADDVDLQIFVAYPGTLASFPHAFDFADPGTMAARVGDLGLVALATNGTAVFLDAYTYDLEAAASWPSGSPLPEGGAFVPLEATQVARVTWGDAANRAMAFDVSADAWADLPAPEPAIGARAHAAWLAPEPGLLHLFGGGAHRDGVQWDLRTGRIEPLDLTLDAPRPHATAFQVDAGAGPEPLLAGTGDALPPLSLPARGQVLGPIGAWTGLRCQQVDDPAAGDVRVLCGGGLRDGVPTADGLLVALPRTGEASVEAMPGLLTVAMDDPLWFADPTAIYAQGAERWIRFEKSDLAASEPPGSPLRARGGHAVAFPSGATFIVGGETADQAPVNRWQVFAPTVSP